MIDTVMESDGGLNFQHRRSRSSDRFLGVSSPTKNNNSGGNSVAGDELNEDDVFWTGDFAEPNRKSNPYSADGGENIHHRFAFLQPKTIGILAALPDEEQNRSIQDRTILCRKHLTSSSSSRTIPAVPKPLQKAQERKFSQSMPARKFHQSVPMNVPVMAKVNAKNIELVDVDDEDGGEEEMLPPHEIVARGSAMEQNTTFSMLEGVGRTLKGRDLRQVRNAVWRQTGFLD